MSTNKIQTGIRFEPEVLYKITYIAKQNVRSLNAQLEFLAKECIKGLWGNGDERKKRLKDAGYDYNQVQKRVNELL